MAWQFVGVSSVVEVTATSHALVTTGITGLAAGDLLVACISSRIASTTSITLPSGGEWTLVGEQKNNNVLATNAALPSGLMAYCIRGASNPNLTFTHPTAPSVALGRIVAYRDVTQVSPKDTQTAFQTATAVTAVSGTGLTTTVANDLIVAMACGGQEAAWSAFNATSPAGASGATSTAAPTTTWLERADSLTTTGVDTSLAIFDAIKSAAGATGNLTATASVAAGHVVIAGAFKMPSTDDAWNSNDKSANITLSNSDKTATTTSASSAGVRSTTTHLSGTAGKYYAELVLDVSASGSAGLKTTTSVINNAATESVAVATLSGSIQLNGSGIGSIGSGFAATDVLCMAWDAGAETIWFRKNNALWNNNAAADPATGTNGLNISSAPNTAHALWFTASISGKQLTLRTEAAEYTQAVPSGFTSWMGETLAINETTTFAATGAVATASTIEHSRTAEFAAATAVASMATIAIEFDRTTASAATAAMTTVAAVTHGRATLFAASATLATAATRSKQRETAFDAAGSMATAATVAGEDLDRTTAFNAAGAMLAVAAHDIPRTTAIVADGTFATLAARTIARVTACEAAGAMATAAAHIIPRATAFAATGSMASVATATAPGAVSTEFSAAGSMATVATRSMSRATSFAATGSMTSVGDTGVVVPPIFVGGGVARPPRPFPVEGYGYGILPELEGEAHGVVVQAGSGVATLAIAVAADGTIGVAGRSAARLAIKAAASGGAGARGNGAGMIAIKGAADARHEDDDMAVVTWLLAA